MAAVAPQGDAAGELPAGDLGSWLDATRRALTTGAGADVPCGTCTACCRASHFVHIEPDETETLRRIPKGLAFPAPGRPQGHVLLGYDGHGRCPMLVDDRCSIYAHRPRTCRAYDCRVYAATGLSADDDRKPAVAAQAVRWRFVVATPRARQQQEAVQAAAAFLRERPDCFPGGRPPGTAGDLAVAAVKASAAFVGLDDRPVDVAAVRAALCG